jgi:hypothetical protein
MHATAAYSAASVDCSTCYCCIMMCMAAQCRHLLVHAAACTIVRAFRFVLAIMWSSARLHAVNSIVLIASCAMCYENTTRLCRFVKKHKRRVVPVCTPSLLGAGSTPKPTWWLLLTAVVAAAVLALVTAATVS